MTIAHVGTGSIVAGTTSLTIPIPSGGTGDLLVVPVANKYPTNGPSTPSGWTQVEQHIGGLGSAGNDSGPMYVTALVREADGSEGTDLSVTLTGANVAQGMCLRYSKDSAAEWSVAATKGAFANPSTMRTGTETVTCDSNPGIIANDVLLACGGINGNGQTSIGNEAMAATGISSWGSPTPRGEAFTSEGNDQAIFVSEHVALAGAATAAPQYSASANGGASATASSPSGPVVVLRIREVAPAAPTGTVTIGEIVAGIDAILAPYDYDGSDATGFEARINGGAPFSIGASPATITGLTPNEVYSPGLEIRAKNATGEGAWSDSVEFATENPFEGGGGPATGATGNATLDAGYQVNAGDSASLNLGYAVTAASFGALATGYQVNAGDNATLSAATVVDITSTSARPRVTITF